MNKKNINYVNFSVLICVYKNDDPALFNLALESIFKNSLQPQEVILVVDGEINQSLEIIINAFKDYNYFTVIRNLNNPSFVNSLNLGLQNICSEWVIRCDADDINMPERFQTLLDHITEDIDLIGSYIAENNENNEIYAIRKVPLMHVDILRAIKKRSPFNHMSIAFRRNLVIKLGGYPKIELREDWCLWATMLANGAKSKNIQDILVHASAGNKMIKRRKGGAIIKTEIALQSHLVKTNISSLPEAIVFGFLRIISFKLPNFLLKIIYDNILRR